MAKQSVYDHTLSQKFQIAGLAFEPNTYFPGNSMELSKLASSPGPLISDYVTHESDFHYSTYGIHVGQDDRLTFFGNVDQKIIGYFVDCRAGSPTEKQQVIIEYRASMARRLIIPRGVAHTFDNLENVITRDAPIWYMDDSNPDYNIDNDLISVSRDVSSERFPSVQCNRHRLSDDAHALFSRFQQRVLNSPSGYSQREQITIAGENRYVLMSPKTWTDLFAEQFSKLLEESWEIPGAVFEKNSFALTGPNSYTVVPSTSHAVSDILAFIPDAHFRGQFKVHRRSDHRLTVISPHDQSVEISLCDLRTGGAVESKTINPDPRYSITIPAGVAYRIRGGENLFVRVEQIPLTDNNVDVELPDLGHDVTWISQDEVEHHRITVARLRLPDGAHRLLARIEAENFINQKKLAIN